MVEIASITDVYAPVKALGAWPTGSYLRPVNVVSLSSTAFPATLQIFMPIIVPSAKPIAKFSVPLATLIASSLCRMGLYAPDGTDGVPGTLLCASVELALSTGSGTEREADPESAYTPTPGLYWLCFHNNAVTTGPTLVRSNSSCGSLVAAAGYPTSGTTPVRYYAASSPQAYGTLPATAPAVIPGSSTSGIYMGLKAG